MSEAKNNEGRFALSLPSGKSAVMRPYDAYIADAIGDVALQEEGTAYDKAICGLVEAIDGVPMPSFEQEREAAIKTARELLLNDYHHILFMGVASFRDGVFYAEKETRSGGVDSIRVNLLNADGSPIERYEPPAYPNGKEKVFEWEEEIPNVGERKFKLHLLDGAARAKMMDTEKVNMNLDLILRRPSYWDDDTQSMRLYQPKARPPAWASKAISRKIREIDPVIQYTSPELGGASLFGLSGFFLQDFT